MHNVTVFSVLHRVRSPLMYRYKSSLNHVIKVQPHAALILHVVVGLLWHNLCRELVHLSPTSQEGQRVGGPRVDLPLPDWTGSVPAHIRCRGPLPAVRA